MRGCDPTGSHESAAFLSVTRGHGCSGSSGRSVTRIRPCIQAIAAYATVSIQAQVYASCQVCFLGRTYMLNDTLHQDLSVTPINRLQDTSVLIPGTT